MAGSARRETEYVEVEIDRILAVTEKALLVSYDNGEELWVPKSLVEDSDTYIRGEYDFIMIADWFARKEARKKKEAKQQDASASGV